MQNSAGIHMLYVKFCRYSTFCTELAVVAHITVSNSGSGIENQHLKVTNRQIINRQATNANTLMFLLNCWRFWSKLKPELANS